MNPDPTPTPDEIAAADELTAVFIEERDRSEIIKSKAGVIARHNASLHAEVEALRQELEDLKETKEHNDRMAKESLRASDAIAKAQGQDPRSVYASPIDRVWWLAWEKEVEALKKERDDLRRVLLEHARANCTFVAVAEGVGAEEASARLARQEAELIALRKQVKAGEEVVGALQELRAAMSNSAGVAERNANGLLAAKLKFFISHPRAVAALALWQETKP